MDPAVARFASREAPADLRIPIAPRRFRRFSAVILAPNQWTRFTRKWPHSRTLNKPPKTMDKYLACFDLLRRKAVSRMQIGGASPEASAPSSRVENAPLSRSFKPLALACAQRRLRATTAANETSIRAPLAAQLDKMCWQRRERPRNPAATILQRGDISRRREKYGDTGRGGGKKEKGGESYRGR